MKLHLLNLVPTSIPSPTQFSNLSSIPQTIFGDTNERQKRANSTRTRGDKLKAPYPVVPATSN